MSGGWQRSDGRGGSGASTGRTQIIPFTYGIHADPEFAKRTWTKLRKALRQILRRNVGDLSYEALYRCAYNLVLHKHGEILYEGLMEELRTHLDEVQDSLFGLPENELLDETLKQWTWFCHSLGQISDVLMYFDRNYVEKKRSTKIVDLGLGLFRDRVLTSSEIATRLSRICMSILERARSGEDYAVLGSVNNISQMYIEVGRMDNAVDAYSELFEKPFLLSTADYYQRLSQELIGGATCAEYLQKVEKIIIQEDLLVDACMDNHRTAVKLRKVVENELLVAHASTLLEMADSGPLHMMRENAFEDLRRMVHLLRVVPSAETQLRLIMREEISSKGKEILELLQEEDPVNVIDLLLELRKKFETLVHESFSRKQDSLRSGPGENRDLFSFDHGTLDPSSLVVDKSYVDVINDAFRSFINVPELPEFLCLYLDRMLRSGLEGRSDADIDRELDAVMTIFRLSDEKDVFERHYRNHLSKRLLHGRSSSDEAERIFVAKLKNECGQLYTSKLETMFSDLRNSVEMSSNISLPNLDIEVAVLTAGAWPITYVPCCTLPEEIHHGLDVFQQQYMSRHEGRRLSWIAHAGSHAEVRGHFGWNQEPRTYEFLVNTYQMVILHLFNAKSSLTVKEMREETEIPDEALERNLLTLALGKVRILRKGTKGPELADDDTFSINESFTSRSIRIRVQTISSRKETEKEQEQTRAKIDEDRRPQIEATIVRVMKTRREIDHQQLSTEVQVLLAPRFVPSPVDIKQRIESLIEREFLERCAEDHRRYRYIA